MKKLLWVLPLLFLTLVSCEENFNPYGELKNKYVLNCIVRGDTTFQTVMLSKNYQTEDFNPYSNSENQAIKGALIRIWNGNDKVSLFQDTTIARPEGDQYLTPYTVYATNAMQPNPSSKIEIEAILPNGIRLTSSATVPDEISITGDKSDVQIPPTSKNYVLVKWMTDQKNPVFVIRMAIYYFKHENGEKKRNVVSIPLNYIKYGDEWVPNYPKPLSENTYSVDMTTISKAMELISKDDPNKANYEILSCIMEVLSLDPELGKYYLATARDRDIYSVKLDETDYSNINGGFGVFGVYQRTYWVMRFTHDYINSFGYTPGLSDVK